MAEKGESWVLWIGVTNMLNQIDNRSAEMVAIGFANAQPVETSEKYDVRLTWVPLQ